MTKVMKNQSNRKFEDSLLCFLILQPREKQSGLSPLVSTKVEADRQKRPEMNNSFKALHSLTLPGELDRWVKDSPGRTAIVDGTQRLSFARLDQLSDQLATALVQRGIKNGDVVSCQLPNIWEYVCLFLATSKVGAIFNSQHTASRAHEIQYALGFAQSRAFFYVPEFGGFDYRHMLDQIREELPDLALTVAVRGEAGPGEASFESLLDTDADANLRAFRPDPDDLLILTFTSGTSGTPKGVVHAHDGPVSNSLNLTQLLEIGSSDVLLSASAYSFAYGAWTIMIGIVAGAKQVLMETFEPQGFFELIKREKVSHVFGVPAIATMLVNHPQAESTDFGSLRQFMLAGAPHPPALVYKMRDLFDCTPVMLWGMTETYRGTVTRLDDDLEVIANTVGSFHPGWEMKIIGPDGSELERGQPGELVIRGPWLFREYIKNPRVMEESFTANGFFKTGDEAVIDGDDRVRITGRIKDLIKRGGVPIAPKEIEDIACTHPGIRDCALVAMPDERLGERGCLFVVPETGPQPTLDEILELLAQKELAKYKWPERLELIDELPLNAARKVRKNVLRDLITARLASE